MSYQITYSKRFQKHFQKLQVAEKQQLKAKLALLAENPFHPSLRTKRIQGNTDLFEFSVNMSIRVIWFYEAQSIIVLLDIGQHDILKQY